MSLVEQRLWYHCLLWLNVVSLLRAVASSFGLVYSNRLGRLDMSHFFGLSRNGTQVVDLLHEVLTGKLLLLADIVL